MDWSASLDTGGVVGPAEAATAALAAMREELKAAGDALAGLGGKAVGPLTGGAGKAVGAPVAAREKAAPSAAKPALDEAAKKKKEAEDFKKAADKAYGKKSDTALREGGADKALAALGKQQESEKKAREKAAAAAKEKKREEQKSSVSGLAGKALGLAGVAGAAATAFDVTKIAIGYRALAQIQGITARAEIGFRQLFRGVDPAPLVRAVDRLSRNFTAQTVMGRAMGDALTRSFNGIFSAVEKLEPYVTAFGQGMVLAFLYAENAVLRARIALAPYAGTLDGIISSTSLMRVAAIGGGIALAIGAGYAAAAAAPFLALAAAILAVTAAFEQASKLQKEWDGSAFWNKVKSDLGINSKADNEKALGITVGSDKAAPKAAAGGELVGAALGKGIVSGLDGSNAAVTAAGARAADAAVKGAKVAAEIRSPSHKWRREVGRQMGEGAALGMDDSAGRVGSAAGSMMPDASKLGIGGGARGGMAITGPLVSVGQIVVQNGGELAEEIQRLIDMAAARAVESLGLARPART